MNKSSEQSHGVSQYWQTTKSTLLERANYLFETSQHADCEFLVGGTDGSEQELIKAHKLYLAQSSPVFDAMFFGEMAQSASHNEPITLPDLTPSSFRDLLKYIYTDVLDLQSLDQAMGLCYAAKKYILPDLVAKCVQYMLETLSAVHACRVLEFSKLINNGHLKAKCWSFIRERTGQSLLFSDFEEVSESTLISIVKDEALNFREVRLFDAVKRWSQRQCTNRGLPINGTNMRETLNKVIGHIRFLTMTSEEFASSVVDSGILTKDECLAVFMHFNIPKLDGERSWSLQAVLSLNRQKRRGSGTFVYTNEIGKTTVNHLYCLRQIPEYEMGFLYEPDVEIVTSFTVDHDVTIAGIVFAELDLSNRQLIKGEDEIVITCRLLDDSNGKFLASAISIMQAKSSPIVCDPTFNRPIRVKRYSLYRIVVTVSQRAYFLIGKASPIVYCRGNQFKFWRDELVRGLIVQY